MTHSPDGASAGGLDLDALEKVARAATGGPWLHCEVERPIRIGDAYADSGWSTEFVGHEILGLDDKVVHSATSGYEESDDAIFAATFDPPTVLKMIAALRALSPSPGLGGEGVHLAPNVRGQEPRSSVLTSTPCQSEWRPEVRAFADLMETKLRKNDHKPGWKRDSAWDLLRRLVEETEEIRQAVRYAEEYDTSDRGARLNPWLPVAHEAADVANFAMMIADVCGALSSEAPSPKSEGEDR